MSESITIIFQELDLTATSILISSVAIVEEEPGEQLEEAVTVISLMVGHHKQRK